MGLLDKLKGAVNAVTGGAAKVTIEFQPALAYPGDTVKVKITTTSTGQEVKSKGIFVDLRGVEELALKKGDANTLEGDLTLSKTTFEQEFKIAPELVLAANETKTFEGSFQIPAGVQPTFKGTWARYTWEIRGRMEAFGNDPDSGFQPFMVGLKS